MTLLTENLYIGSPTHSPPSSSAFDSEHKSDYGTVAPVRISLVQVHP
jgi:hypothetical protein